MKTLFVGGGHGCRAVLDLVVNRKLAVLSPEVVGVVDPNPDAPGMVFARRQGWSTFASLEQGLNLPELELVIEVTGMDDVLEEIRRLAPERVRIMDHDMARVFWDLDGIARNLRDELRHKTDLEEEIREDRRRLQELLDSLPDSVMVLDESGRIERVNRRFEEITGLTASRVEGELCRSVMSATVGERECSEEFCPRLRAVESGSPLTVIQQQSCIRGACVGDECYYQITANPIRGGGGETNVVITSREVTEQIRLARETEQLAQRADQILNTVQGIITISGMDGRFEFINPRAEEFFGRPREELVGRTPQESLPEEVAGIFVQNDETFLTLPSGRTMEETIPLAGDDRTLITERVLLRDYKGDPAGICRVSRDVTESRRMQQELVESEKHAAVGKLAAGVAHELNNPLTGILTFAEDMLEDTPEGPDLRDDLRVILRETIRCRQIVRDLLDFSRQTEPNPQDLPIEPVILRAVKLVEKQVAFHDIEFDLDLHESSLRVFADANQLQQVLLNLIINARDAMDGKGTITVRTLWRRAKRRVVIEVVDEGCGITPDHMDRIFEPFFSTKGDRGNGLGLAAVRSIIEQHRGEIAVESQPGAGSTFAISLPRVGMEYPGPEGIPAA
jgi:PAS domain S-box-containing protein